MQPPQPWNPKNRVLDLESARGRHFDVVIIGGGITGAGIARECALRGLSFCLLEKKDFAFGTSSRSSKLFHGGMRYLSSFEFGLVRESATERNWLSCHLPHLVRPLGFIYSSFEKGKDRPYMVRAAMKLYDILSDWFNPFHCFKRSKILKPSALADLEPAFTEKDPDLGRLLLAGYYFDTSCDDARTTLETIRESLHCSAGASVALNYTRVEGFLKDPCGKVRAVTAIDQFSGESLTIRGKAIVSAAGIWTDEVLARAGKHEPKIYPTKGVHLVVPNERVGNRNAFGIRSFDDGRFFFVLRRGKATLIGTTDTPYDPESNNLNEPWCSKEDCDYLLRAVNRLFPRANLTYEDIIGTYAGIRPLIREEGAKKASDVSRNHRIFTTPDGLVAIAGGKSTTFRRMAEDLLFYLVKEGVLPPLQDVAHRRRGFTKQPFLVGITRDEFARQADEQNFQADPDLLEYLYQQYGREALRILTRIRDNPASGQPLLKGYPHCEAEIRHILTYENAPKLIDVLCRRTEAQWLIWHHKQPALANAVARIMADDYHWAPEQTQAEIEEYLDYVQNTVKFIPSK